MGGSDPSGLLKDGEVGLVIIHRLDPNDIRFLTAVDIP